MQKMSSRVYNFSAGPAVLPEEVLVKAQENLLNYQGTGIGVMELSHRGPEFAEIIGTAIGNLKELLGVSDDFEVLFTTGGATNQFSMMPMNLLHDGDEANYVLTGVWAKNAAAEAKKFGKVHIAASSEDSNFNYIPDEIKLSAKPAYLHFTSNNTIYGTQFSTEPDAGNIPLVCDASSDLLHKPLDMNRYHLIYAGAQKNLGPAGVTLVIIRKDLLERSAATLPIMMNYSTYAASNSLYNTPPTFPIYVMGEVFKWLKDQGGLSGIERQNTEKATLLYDELDRNEFYRGTARKDSRSSMNICFRLPSEELEAKFISSAAAQGLKGLKGHRDAGGIRASIYNAFPKAGVETLVSFMRDFAAKNG